MGADTTSKNKKGTSSADAAKKPRKKRVITMGMRLILLVFLAAFALTVYVSVVPFADTVLYGLSPELDTFAADLSKAIDNWDYRETSDMAIVTDKKTVGVLSGAYVLCVLTYLSTRSKTKPEKYPMWVYPISIIHHGILACLSVAMAIGMGRGFFTSCVEHGWDSCMNLYSPGGDATNGANYELWVGASGFFMWLFSVSKYYEFLDTGVMMGKSYDLIFLHWWHHATVPVLMVVHANEHSAAAWTGSWFNCVVHTVMYSYYTVAAIGFSLNSVKQLITGLQLLQFVTVLGHIGWLHYVNGTMSHPLTYAFAYSVYGSYLALFINFFLQTYIFKKGKGSKRKTA